MVKIARDKKVHFYAGALAGFVGGWLVYVFINGDRPEIIGGAITLAIAIGCAKEIYDIKKETGFDKKDLLATAIGGAVSAAAWLGFSFLRGF